MIKNGIGERLYLESLPVGTKKRLKKLKKIMGLKSYSLVIRQLIDMALDTSLEKLIEREF